jgi:hypothetical protein
MHGGGRFDAWLERTEDAVMLDGLTPMMALVALFSYPAYLLIMACVLRACGVPRKEIARWALRQADRQRAADLVRSLRRGPTDEPESTRETGGGDADPPA